MYNPNEIYQALIQSGTEWADKKAAYEQLNDVSKSILAKLKMAAPGNSDAKQTTIALAHNEYLIHLSQISEARQEFLISQVRYHSMQALADARRTEASTLRAEAKYVGIQEG